MFTGRERKFMERWRLLKNSLFLLVGLVVVFGSALMVRADSEIDDGTYQPYEGAKYALRYIKYEDDEGEYYIEITGVVKPEEELKDWGRLVIPDEIEGATVTSIGNSAFKGCSSLTGELELPSGLTSIGGSAFERCWGLTGELELPSGLTEIGNRAFSGCSELTGDLTIPKSVTSWGKCAFDGCSFQNVTIGASKIPDYAFGKEDSNSKGCKFTGKLTLEETVTSIGEYAFYGCSGLMGELILPSGLTEIGWYAFSGCSGLTGELVLPSGLTEIEAGAFDHCRGLTGELVLPSGLTKIGWGAFSGCSGLTGLVLPSGLTSIGEAAFSGCSGLTGELVLPSGLTEIGRGAFDDCSGLTGELVLPSGLTEIEAATFVDCSGLMGLVLPRGLTSIGEYAFSGCSGLTGELKLPSGLTSVGECAFEGCGIVEVVIPKSVTSIGTGAFQQCNIYGYRGSEAENYVKQSEDTWYACTFIPLDGGEVDTPVKVTYEIRFNGNGATGGSMDALTKCEVGTGYALPTNGFTRTDYTFTGWNTKADGTGTAYKDKATIKDLTMKNGAVVTLYAQWRINSYSIAFSGNGSTGGSMAKLTGCEVGTSYTLPINGFIRTGYTFTGWNTKADGSGTAYADKSSVKDLAKKDGAVVTLYAQWKANSYSIAFKGNGSTEGEMSTLTNRKVGTSYTLPANKFKRTGYTFSGWNTKKDGSGTVYANKASVKDLTKTNGATVTLYAQWKKNSVTYQIKFNGNGGTGKMSALKCKTGQSYKLPANAFKKQGYTFAGWNTKKDGKGKSFKNKASVKDLTKKSGAVVTLYAQWKPNTYTVKFDGNKATGGKMKDLENCQYGKSFKLTKSAYKRKGYTFAGWNTKKNGTGKSYKNGAQVKNLTGKNKGTVVLYAQWIKKK